MGVHDVHVTSSSSVLRSIVIGVVIGRHVVTCCPALSIVGWKSQVLEQTAATEWCLVLVASLPFLEMGSNFTHIVFPRRHVSLKWTVALRWIGERGA